MQYRVQNPENDSGCFGVDWTTWRAATGRSLNPKNLPVAEVKGYMGSPLLSEAENSSYDRVYLGSWTQ